jgi:hypothetical protein
MIEFDCEGCGAHVYGYNRGFVSGTYLCSVCEWFCEHEPDPKRMITYMLAIDHLPPLCRHIGCQAARVAELGTAAHNVFKDAPRQVARLRAEAVAVGSRPVQCRRG